MFTWTSLVFICPYPRRTVAPLGTCGNRLDAITVPNGPSPGSPWARTSLAVGTPLLALIVGGGSVWYLRRPRGGQSRHALSGRS
jgi:hypothetical protein